MEEKLARVYQLLNVINISGHQNILALGEANNIINNILIAMAKERTDKEQQKEIDVLNSQKPTEK